MSLAEVHVIEFDENLMCAMIVCICCRYLLAVAVLAFVYTLGQVVYQVYGLSTEKYLIPRRAMGILDFAGDQVRSISAFGMILLFVCDKGISKRAHH